MNAASRAAAMLVDPAAEWAVIQQESGDPAYLLSRYVAALALVPAICSALGASAIGVTAADGTVVRASLFDGVFGAIFGYAESFAIVLAVGLIINLIAPLFGGRRDFDSAFKLAVYAYTPVWLAGIFLLLPGLRFLILLGCYGAYLAWTGLPRLMKSPPQHAQLYALVVAVCAGALTLIAAAAQRALFSTPGL
jgi:hypothetical protein